MSFSYIPCFSPVKAVCSFLGIDPTLVGCLDFLVLLGVLYHNATDVLYFCIKIFLNSVLSIFFKSIEIVGKDNIPMDGPVIFTGNHANQFVDGMIVMMNCFRKVKYNVLR
jgi:glycerol-3-phosphate O-acyltransferase/dihydroxyacetone phosphate acyltransferase